MTVRNLDKLFRPRSVAVIGASAKPGSLGNLVFENLRAFQGSVYAVNPRGGKIGGENVYTSIASLPSPPDVAVIMTPADAVAGVVSELGAVGCKAAVVLTAGFGEGTDDTGPRRRAALLAAARPNLFRIVGPNCLGVLVPSLGFNASFARTSAVPGNLALVAQSGAVASALLDWSRPRGIGFSHVVTLGDMIDVDFGDMLDYLAVAPDTRAILLYVEGITHARKFMSAARRAARIKPVLVIKAGRTATSAKIAASHTGALAGSDAVYEAVFARAGILRVEDLDDLFSAAELLALGAPIKGDRLAIVTNGGGLGVLAADRLLADHGRLADLSVATLERLSAALPAVWSQANPVDIIGDAGPERYTAALDAVLADPDVDAALAIHCPTAAADPEVVAATIADVSAQHAGKPVLTSWTGEESVAAARALFSHRGVPTFATPNAAVRGFMQLVRYRRLQDLLMETPQAMLDAAPTAVSDVREVIAKVRESQWLSPVNVRKLLAAYGIATNRAVCVENPREAAVTARAWHCRVALKILSPDIIHKSDVGGVILDVAPETAEDEGHRLLNIVRVARPEARIEGILVEEMIKRPGAHELFLGMTLDPTFGPVIAFGHGGTAVEVVDDKAFGLPPLNPNLAKAMIEGTRVGRLLAGYRNRPPADLEAIAAALTGLSQLAADHPQIVDLDINPLLADERGVIAVDARMKIDPAHKMSDMIITPYPRVLERTLSRQGGTPIFVRPLKPHDTATLTAFAHHLSSRDVRFRFFVPLHDAGGGFVARLSQLDYDREMALVAFEKNNEDALALAHFHADPDNVEAEFAIAVRSDRQGQGIGFAILSYLLEIARQRGLSSLWGDVLSDNNHMLDLARALGMREEASQEPGIVRVRIDLRNPAP